MYSINGAHGERWRTKDPSLLSPQQPLLHARSSKMWKQGICLDLHRPLIYARMPNFRQPPASSGTQYHASCVSVREHPGSCYLCLEPRRTSRLPMDPVKVDAPWLERDCCFAMLPFSTSSIFFSSPDRPMREQGKIAGVICLSTVVGRFDGALGLRVGQA